MNVYNLDPSQALALRATGLDHVTRWEAGGLLFLTEEEAQDVLTDVMWWIAASKRGAYGRATLLDWCLSTWGTGPVQGHLDAFQVLAPEEEAPLPPKGGWRRAALSAWRAMARERATFKPVSKVDAARWAKKREAAMA